MIQRNLTAHFIEAISDTPAVFLCGARQTGKSTLVKQLAAETEGWAYYTLDDLDTLSAARQNPQGFVAGLPERVVIDEIQRAPDILLPIKAEIDRNRKPGRFILTGSANVLLLPRVADTLAGRIEILTLRPFSQGELLGRKETFIDAIFNGNIPLKTMKPSSEKTGLYERVLTGGYPEIVRRARPARRNAWYSAYISTIIQRDILELSKIEGLHYIPRLIRLAAGRSGKILSYSELGGDIELPQSSLKRYFALLESAFILFTVQSWHANFSARQIKSPKLYMTDTGLLAYLLGINEEYLEKNPSAAGHIVENFAVNEICKQLSWSSSAPALYHFRSHDGREVDCVLENRRGECVGIEVKASSNVTSRDCRGLAFLKEELGDRFLRGFILFNGAEIIPFDNNIHAVPIDALWTA